MIRAPPRPTLFPSPTLSRPPRPRSSPPPATAAGGTLRILDQPDLPAHGFFRRPGRKNPCAGRSGWSRMRRVPPAAVAGGGEDRGRGGRESVGEGKRVGLGGARII